MAVLVGCLTISRCTQDEFLVCTGDKIQLLSADFEAIREQPLSPAVRCWQMVASPDRRFFLTPSKEDYRLIDADSLQTQAMWSSKQATHVQCTDVLLIGVCKPEREICMRKVNQDWETFHPAGTDYHIRTLRNQGPFFVNDSTLAIPDGGEMSVVTLAGALVFGVELSKKFSFAREATSTGGARFAFIETERRGSAALDWSMDADDHVVVYDVAQKKAIYTRTVRGGSPWIPPFEEHRNRLALSPDGAMLALLDDGIVEVFQLPASSAD